MIKQTVFAEKSNILFLIFLPYLNFVFNLIWGFAEKEIDIKLLNYKCYILNSCDQLHQLRLDTFFSSLY